MWLVLPLWIFLFFLPIVLRRVAVNTHPARESQSVNPPNTPPEQIFRRTPDNSKDILTPRVHAEAVRF